MHKKRAFVHLAGLCLPGLVADAPRSAKGSLVEGRWDRAGRHKRSVVKMGAQAPSDPAVDQCAGSRAGGHRRSSAIRGCVDSVSDKFQIDRALPGVWPERRGYLVRKACATSSEQTVR